MQLAAVANILGGQRVLRRRIASQLDLIELADRGLPKLALTCLAEFLGSSAVQIAQLLPVSARTIQRYGPRDHLSKVTSEQVLQIAQVAARGEEVFGDKDRLLAWVRQPSTALGGNSPMSLLSSRFGAEMVLDELGRIEYGVVS